ncbi:MAG: serine/threonine-protein kinase, partial [Anaerolineales bacterium]
MVTTQLLGRDYFVSGDEIGEFTLLEIIGGGGEGGIWSGWDKVNERIVALKFFQLDDTTRTLDKRREDLLALANLDHPNVRKVYSTGDGPGFLYFALTYYPSGSLADRLRGRPLAPDVALKTGAQIARALEYIHSQRVIHRDLKPTNILIDDDMHAFLTDFGIARTLSDSTIALHTGQGTPAYSSPEQHTKSFIDHKTDIYSFGVMLFEMFTGNPPWQGLASLAIRQLEDTIEIPDPRESNPDLPEGLHGVLKKLTARKPENRPNTIVEAFELVLDVWDPASLGDDWRGVVDLSMDTVLSMVAPFKSPDEVNRKEAEALLARTMGYWRQAEGKLRMGLTAFIFLDNHYSRSNALVRLTQGQISFLAMFSVIHGRNTDFWWDKVSDPKLKLVIAENILEQEVGTPVLNILNLVLLDPKQFSGIHLASDKLIQMVLEQVHNVNSPDVIQKAILLL